MIIMMCILIRGAGDEDGCAYTSNRDYSHSEVVYDSGRPVQLASSSPHTTQTLIIGIVVGVD